MGFWGILKDSRDLLISWVILWDSIYFVFLHISVISGDFGRFRGPVSVDSVAILGLRVTILGKRRIGEAPGRGSTRTKEHQERTSADKELGTLSPP